MPSLAGHPRSRQLVATFLSGLQAQGYPVGVGHHQLVQELLNRLPTGTDELALRDSLVALFATSATEQRLCRDLFAEAQRIVVATGQPVEESEDTPLTQERKREKWRLIRRLALLASLLLLPVLAYWLWPAQEFILNDRIVGVYANTRTPLPNLDSLTEIGRVGEIAWPAPGESGAPIYGRLDTIGGPLVYEAPNDTVRETFVLTLRGTNKRVVTVRYNVIVQLDTARTQVPGGIVKAKPDTTLDFSPIDPLPHPRTFLDLVPVEPENVGYVDLLYDFWWPLMAICFLILLAILYQYLRYLRKRSVKLVAELEETDGAPHFWRIELPELRAGIDWGENYPALLRQLRRRREDDFRELDLGQTIDQTIRQGGFPSVQFRSATRPAEYLLLIDRGGASNHHARLFEQLYQQLIAEEVLIARYFYDGDPRLLYQHDRTQSTPLLQLQRRFPNARLLLVGSGDRLLNPASGRLAKWVAQQFGPWTNRSLLTTLAPNDWGAAERRLSGFFAVLPASMQGLRLLVERINDGNTGEAAIDYRTLVSDAHREPIQLSGSLLGSLQKNFTTPQLQWIAACALYPSLHWDLTLFLGQTVGEATGYKLLTSQNLLSLSRLPWFVQGSIPKVARQELLEWLRLAYPDLHRNFRRALDTALQQAPPPPDNSLARRDLDFFQLNNEFHLTTPGSSERREVLDKIGSYLASGYEADVAVARFLEEPDENAIVLPKSWHKRLYPEGLPGLGFKPELKKMLWGSIGLLFLVGFIGWWQQPAAPNNVICDSPLWTVSDTLNFAQDTLLQIQICDKLDSLILEEHRWRERINQAQSVEDLHDTIRLADLPGLDENRQVVYRPDQAVWPLEELVNMELRDSLDSTYVANVGAMLWNRGLALEGDTAVVSEVACGFYERAGQIFSFSVRRRAVLERCVLSSVITEGEEVVNVETNDVGEDAILPNRGLSVPILPNRIPDGGGHSTDGTAFGITEPRDTFISPNDLRADQIIFEQKAKFYQQWLDEVGIGKVLRFRELDVQEKELAIYLEFYSSDLDTIINTWRLLKASFEQESTISLENALFYEALNLMEVRQSSLSVQLYDTYDPTKEPLFSRVIYFEGGKVSVLSSMPKSPITPIESKPIEITSEDYGKGYSCSFVGVITKGEVYDCVLEYAEKRFSKEECRGKNPELRILERGEVLRFEILDLCNEILPKDDSRVFKLFENLDLSLQKRELLTFTFQFSKNTKGGSVFVHIDGKVGSGLYRNSRRGAFIPMGQDFKNELSVYRNRFSSELQGALIGCFPDNFSFVPYPLMTQIPAATFQMGDTFNDGGENEKPVHKVSLSRYSLGRYEVTFEEYDLFCQRTGREKPGDNGWGRSRRPVINVSWYDAIAYCNWLSNQHDYDAVYTINSKKVAVNWSANGYRLPTEAEWEYAASYRPDGNKARFGNGQDTINPAEVNFAALANYQEEYSEIGPYRKQTVPTGILGNPNQLQLHDLSGNVYELCWDLYDGSYYGELNVKDPRGPIEGTNRVVRGGSWYNHPIGCRAADRFSIEPTIRSYYLGFRLARSF